ncbi:MD-2-related lipid-recognition protein-like [Uranotaenia lowii]|uniref:MD-2-related lipid-recognition protein-like n=1 Tax=Uranotaenia lowii TaxID=190385 RepID=UPI002478C501|nr:MD-2-related lipid-recognition protein-like [Uranotaenia lowii]
MRSSLQTGRRLLFWIVKMNHSWKAIIFCALFVAVSAEIVKFSNCKETTKCQVHQVRIDPCPESASNKPCTMLKGTNATIAFDYTPEFDAQVATAKAFWTQTAMDLPFAGMDSEGCKYTSCPLQSGTKQSYSYDLPIQKKYPTRVYDVKWILENEAEEMCCFIIQISVKSKKGRS